MQRSLNDFFAKKETKLLKENMTVTVTMTADPNNNVTNVSEKDERHLASNYRPVSLTSITCKILEHIVHSNIMDHFDKNKILTNAQHGFHKKNNHASPNS